MTLFLLFASAPVSRGSLTRQPLFAAGYPVRSTTAVAAPVRATVVHER